MARNPALSGYPNASIGDRGQIGHRVSTGCWIGARAALVETIARIGPDLPGPYAAPQCIACFVIFPARGRLADHACLASPKFVFVRDELAAAPAALRHFQRLFSVQAGPPRRGCPGGSPRSPGALRRSAVRSVAAPRARRVQHPPRESATPAAMRFFASSRKRCSVSAPAPLWARRCNSIRSCAARLMSVSVSLCDAGNEAAGSTGIQRPKPHATFDCGAGHEGVRRAGFGLASKRARSRRTKNEMRLL